MTRSWRDRAATAFRCEKRPAFGDQGMVVTNHPLASASGAEMLAGGGNAIDAAIAALFTLTVVEPMNVGIIGGGMAHIRLGNGTHTVIDGMSRVPMAGHPTMFQPVPGAAPHSYDTLGRRNTVGPQAVAAPGTLKAWCEILLRFGTFSLQDVLGPAIRHAERGFLVTPFLSDCITDASADLALDSVIAELLLPNGVTLKAGDRLVMGAYADTLRLIARDGPDALYNGSIGDALIRCMEQRDGFISRQDLTEYSTRDREVLRNTYRGWDIAALPPPSAAGVHMAQMLNILEHYDIAGLGFGSRENVHLLAEVLKIAFADRAAATGDPDYVDVPVAQLTSKVYAADRQAHLAMDRAQDWHAAVGAAQSANTTHLTVADAKGNVVAATQTINSTFGARFMIPGTGIIPNNYMATFDPRPGNALSIVPGKRVTTSMAPTMALKDGRLRYALGLPGGKRIFPSVMQALINLIDHGMSAQEAVEAPRVWTEGPVLELEDAFSDRIVRGLRSMGHAVQVLPTVAGGMSCIAFHDDGLLEGAACWRADGTAVGLGGGRARPGARFWPDAPVVPNQLSR